ncbi:MAG: hypothetical protein GY780_17545, partial [bacterium]|nr:hypothetical protein [bacterium]
MQRQTTIIAILLLSALIWVAGCSTPSEPDSLAYGGNSQSDDTPDNDNPSPTVGINIGNEAPDFTLADTYGED